MTVVIMAVLKREMVTPPCGEPPYIQSETVVHRFADGTPLTGALSVVEAAHPNALSYEIYRPRTDHEQVERL